MNVVVLYGAISASTTLIPISTGLWGFSKLRIELKLLLAILLISILVDGYTFFEFYQQGNGHWAHHLYAPTEYCFLAAMFSFWQPNPKARKLILLSIPVFVLISIISIILLRHLTLLNDFTASLASALYVIISLYTLIKIQEDDKGSILKDYRFWICAAVMVYYSAALAYFAFLNLIPPQDFTYVWLIHLSLNGLTNIIYAMAMVFQWRT
jgi:hypothetical protein